ncbi:MAG: tetratricopeptide repeat protein [Xanthomonadaceae bacterium]|nr:tetratricopeptide repeat protein [Xanthomonadaceae bacterium]
MAKSKISVRRELRQPDGFMKTVNAVQAYAKSHSKKVIVGGVVVLALLIMVMGTSAYLGYQNKQASMILGVGLQYFDDMSQPDSLKTGIAKLETGAGTSRLAASYPLACYLRGNGYYVLKQYDKADQAYQEALAKASSDPYLADLCRLGLAYVDFEKRDYPGCLEILAKIQADHTSTSEDVYLLLGMSYENLKKYEQAKAAYENLVQFVPDTRYKGWVDERLEYFKLIAG